MLLTTRERKLNKTSEDKTLRELESQVTTADQMISLLLEERKSHLMQI